jgi:hypothetical protein
MGGIAAAQTRARATIAVAVAFLATLVVAAKPAEAASARAAAKARTGQLILRVGGLPRGERPSVTIAGPRQSRKGKPFGRALVRQGAVRLRRLKPGTYRIAVRQVEMRRHHGTVKRGATALPRRKRLRVKVKPGKPRRVDVLYGTILNPGAQALRGRILRVLGNPSGPRGLVLRGRRPYRRGTLLSAAPSARLPEGLLARVTSVRQGSRQTIVRLRAASIYEVAPNLHATTQLEISPLAGASAADCGIGGVSVTPHASIGNVWTDVSWTTTRVWGLGEVETGARLDLDFDATAGAEVETHARLECSLPLTGWAIRGSAKGGRGRIPIPITGSIGPHLNGWIGPGAKFKTEGKARIELGARANVLPLSVWPEVGFGSPSFTFDTEVFAEMGFGVSFDAKLQVGVDDGNNLKAKFGNSLDFSVRPGTCSLDLKLGTFSLSGKVGRWSLPSVNRPALRQENLGQTPCGPPPLDVPLPRAEMSWGTDADVDLYAWDEAGRPAYFAERTGIPGAELIEDVIPSAGETVHRPEVFLEHDSPGRRYTFGVCLYRGVSTDVSLKVTSIPDPRAGDKTFTIPLRSEGEGVVVTSMPEGGFQPPPGWCRSAPTPTSTFGTAAAAGAPGAGAAPVGKAAKLAK